MESEGGKGTESAERMRPKGTKQEQLAYHAGQWTKKPAGRA